MGHPTGELRTALRTGSYQLARNLARELPHVDLRDALQLTVLAASKDPEHFEGMARRWLARFLEEKTPTLQLIKWAVEDLGKVGDSELPEIFKSDAEARLQEVAGKL